MTDNIEIEVIVDDSDFKQKDAEIKQEIAADNLLLDEVEKRSQASFQQVLSLARGAYLVGLGMLKSTGESISYFFRAMISAVFSTATVLYPLITAKEWATWDVIGGAMAIASLGTSIAAAVQAQAQETEIARGLRGIDMSLLGLQQLIGTIGSLW